MHHFEFEVPGVENFAFIPGQFVSVVDREDGKEITHAYSIASPRDGNRFALCLNRGEDEIVSPWLFRLKPGDEVEMSEPVGGFTLRNCGRKTVFVATGTGIAPFRSMLLDNLPESDREITLLFGVRNEEVLLYSEEFEELARRYEKFRFIPTVTRPSAHWQGRKGRVQAHLDEALAIRTCDDLANTDIYICGLREMVDDVREELERRGFSGKQIIYERYD